MAKHATKHVQSYYMIDLTYFNGENNIFNVSPILNIARKIKKKDAVYFLPLHDPDLPAYYS